MIESRGGTTSIIILCHNCDFQFQDYTNTTRARNKAKYHCMKTSHSTSMEVTRFIHYKKVEK